MPVSRGTPRRSIDTQLLYQDLNRKREAYGLSWRELGRILRVYPSGLQRLKDTDGVNIGAPQYAAMVAWLGQSAGWYLNDPVPNPTDGKPKPVKP